MTTTNKLYFLFLITESFTNDALEEQHDCRSVVISGDDEFDIDEYADVVLVHHKLPPVHTERHIERRMEQVDGTSEITIESHGGKAMISKQEQLFITPEQAAAMESCGLLIKAWPDR